jgi:HSP20 family protein
MWRTWRTLPELDQLRREVDRVFDGYWPSWGRLRSAFLPGQSMRSYPLVNVYEDENAVHVEALAPGLDTEELKVSVQGNVLTLSGEKKPLPGVKAEQYHRNERATGKFVRTFSLNTEVDADNVNASYANGILTVTLPKHEKAKPKEVAVSVQ